MPATAAHATKITAGRAVYNVADGALLGIAKCPVEIRGVTHWRIVEPDGVAGTIAEFFLTAEAAR